MPTILNDEGVKFPDNSTQISAKTVLAELPVADNVTVTAGRAVSIGADGKVGAYPVPNAVSAEVASNVFDTYDPINFGNDVSRISKEGTRALGLRTMQSGHINSSFIIQWTGFGITANSITAGSPTANISASAGGQGRFGSAQIMYNNTEDNALLNIMHTNYASSTNNRFRQLSVASNGAVTVGPESSFNLSGTYTTVFQGIRRIKDNVFLNGQRQGANFAFRYVTLNGTGSSPTLNTNTNATIARNMFELGGRTRLTVNNAFIAVNGNTIRKSTFTNASSQLTNYEQYSNYITNVGSSEPSLQTFVTDDGTRAIFIYRNNVAKMEMQVFNINTTTGEPTFVDSIILKEDASVFKLDQVSLAFKSNTEFNFSFLDAGIHSVQSAELNNDGTIKGVNERQTVGSERVEQKYNPGTDKFWLNTKTTGPNTHRIKHGTVNAFSTIPYNSLGVAAETKSSGNVKVIINGIASGFSGLIVGSEYYVDNTVFDGTVATASNQLLVGVAISATELKLI